MWFRPLVFLNRYTCLSAWVTALTADRSHNRSVSQHLPPLMPGQAVGGTFHSCCALQPCFPIRMHIFWFTTDFGKSGLSEQIYLCWTTLDFSFHSITGAQPIWKIMLCDGNINYEIIAKNPVWNFPSNKKVFEEFFVPCLIFNYYVS